MTSTRLLTHTHTLSDLANISFALAEGLRRVGIDSPQQLMALGAEATWQSLKTAGRHDGVQTLLALEGAIQGVPWRAVPVERRHQLMHFFGHSV